MTTLHSKLLLLVALATAVAGWASPAAADETVAPTLAPRLAPELLPERLPRLGVYTHFHEGEGSHVDRVIVGSEAERLGLEPGDMILAINGRKLLTANSWAKILRDLIHGEPQVLLNSNAPKLRLQPTLVPDRLIILTIRDTRTGHVATRQTNLANWD